MKTMSMRHYLSYWAVGLSLVIGTVGMPKNAAAVCCPQVYSIKLLPVDPTTKLVGYAEIVECLNLSFLHIVVKGYAPDGTSFIPTIPGREPMIGEWFEMTNHRAETVWQNVTTYGAPAGGLAGRTLTITDFNFVPILSGTF